jgi:hypothetical protein
MNALIQTLTDRMGTAIGYLGVADSHALVNAFFTFDMTESGVFTASLRTMSHACDNPLATASTLSLCWRA